MQNKKGVSAVIATVLIILLTIVSVSVISVAIISFTRESLGEDRLCTEVQDKISLNSQKSCYILTEPRHSEIWIKFGNVELDEIYLSLEKDSNFEVYVLKDGGESPGDILSPDPIELPQSGGGEKEFVTIDGFAPKKVRVGAIINEKNCPISDELTLKIC